jgi:hypothetical protein
MFNKRYFISDESKEYISNYADIQIIDKHTNLYHGTSFYIPKTIRMLTPSSIKKHLFFNLQTFDTWKIFFTIDLEIAKWYAEHYQSSLLRKTNYEKIPRLSRYYRIPFIFTIQGKNNLKILDFDNDAPGFPSKDSALEIIQSFDGMFSDSAFISDKSLFHDEFMLFNGDFIDNVSLDLNKKIDYIKYYLKINNFWSVLYSEQDIVEKIYKNYINICL